MTPPKRQARKRAVTMRDVAKLANVAQSTVSRVLSGGGNGIPISEETRQRVMEAVETLGYYPNLYAGSLRGQKTYMIAMMVADIANPFYHPMVRAVQDVAHAHRYDVMISNTDHMQEGEILFVESVIRRPVDGVIAGPYHLTDADFERMITRTGVAVVALGQHVTCPQVDTVFGDDEQASVKRLPGWPGSVGIGASVSSASPAHFSAGAASKRRLLRSAARAACRSCQSCLLWVTGRRKAVNKRCEPFWRCRIRRQRSLPPTT
jgi:transcriptional regulator with XRE-family HTH domain